MMNMLRNPVQGCTRGGARLSRDEALQLAEVSDLEELMAAAAHLRDVGHGDMVTYSPKVFIPLTQLCRDVCHYCTFAQSPRPGDSAYLSPEAVLEIARAGASAGCREALFTLGEKPERRYRIAREALSQLGHGTTLSYLHDMAGLVLRETGLLPHINAGTMSRKWLIRLREVSASQGLMLESASDRLCERGGPHHGSPDKAPRRRLATIHAAGLASIPFTTGLLIGIGETRQERIEALLHIRALHERHGHIQEVIIQAFRAKPQTRMSTAPEPKHEELLWTIAIARLIFGAAMSIQAPPNLSPGKLGSLIDAGINDWGGVSPVTSDFVNPEAPWPRLELLREETERAGKTLAPRLTIYPAYLRHAERWTDSHCLPYALCLSDAEGRARPDDWMTGTSLKAPSAAPAKPSIAKAVHLDSVLDQALSGHRLDEEQIVSLFTERGEGVQRVCEAADGLRSQTVGDVATYVVNRNINYTNICEFACGFCAFSKGRFALGHRDRPYLLDTDEVARRALEAWNRGATEVCMQGGIHPSFTGETYLALCRSVKQAVPEMHVHAFSPLEVQHGAATLSLSVSDFLQALREAGLSTLPGTAAEILDDEVRRIICPDKLSTAQWLEIVGCAHDQGLKTTATIMFGHVDRPLHWARHLLRIRDLQERTCGFTEFVPLPFVAGEAPLFKKGLTRAGPTYREAVLMHAIARLVLHPLIVNIQTSWVKMGPDGASNCLRAGCNDLGGTLMNESITRAAGAVHGQEMTVERLEQMAATAGMRLRQRSTTYDAVSLSTPPAVAQ